METAWMSRPQKNKMVECQACHHRCIIPENQSGFCRVRKNENGKLKLLVYGNAVATHTDPIEKKPLYHFYPGSQIFSIGTVGCNFCCQFCQNFEISQFPKEYPMANIDKVSQNWPPEKIVQYCLEHNIPSIAFTYNEPAVFFEYAYDTAQLAKKEGLRVVYVSNGFETPEALEKIHPFLDAINIDLKSFRERFYTQVCCGKKNSVLQNIKWIAKNTDIWLEITTLIITNENDSDEELQNIADFIASINPDIPWHLSRYFPAYKMTNSPTPIQTLERAYNIAQKAGLNYVYIGNMNGMDKSNTQCPNCQEAIILRNGYHTENRLRGRQCPVCKETIAGRF